MLVELLNLVAVIAFIAMVVTMIKRRKGSSTLVETPPKAPRAKQKKQHPMNKVKELIKNLTDLRHDKLKPWIVAMGRSDLCLKKLNIMHLKVQLLHMDQNQQCKKSIVYLEDPDGHKYVNIILNDQSWPVERI